jgi:AcrR family transcriptional regulator
MSPEERPLRRDAQRNRELLVAAAREVFGSLGLDASLEEIARQAGVAIGTLYNRFPTRVSLIEAAFVGALEQSSEYAERAALFEDPWEGFVYFLERACEMRAADRGFTEVCSRVFSDAPALEAAKVQGGETIAKVIRRAQDSGRLRPDFRFADLAIVLNATARAPYWRRHLAYLLDGFRADAAHPLPDEA